MSLRIVLRWVFAIICGIFSSCSDGPSLYSVEGKLLFKGEPATGAMVVFHLEGDKSLNSPKPTAEVQADGTFKIETTGKPGAPAGAYRVVVYWEQKATAPKAKLGISGSEERTSGKNRMAGTPYESADTTPWKVTVGKSSQTLEPHKID